MSKFFTNLASSKFKVVLVLTMFVILSVVGIVIAQKIVKTEQLPILTKDKENLIDKIKLSPDYPVKIKQDSTSLIQIIEATVKEITAEDYEKLTGLKTEGTFVSLPEVKIINNSEKKIIGLTFITRDSISNSARAIIMKDISVPPSQSFILRRGATIKYQPEFSADEEGKVREITKDVMTTENYWRKTSKDNLTVSVVATLEDGEVIANKE
jgi:hypothetical protein